MKHRIACWAVSGLVAAACASATAAEDAVRPALAKPAAPEKKICRTEPNIGSIVPRRICRTPADWAQRQGDADTATDWIRNHRITGGLNGPD